MSSNQIASAADAEFLTLVERVKKLVNEKRKQQEEAGKACQSLKKLILLVMLVRDYLNQSRGCNIKQIVEQELGQKYDMTAEEYFQESLERAIIELISEELVERDDNGYVKLTDKGVVAAEDTCLSA